MTAKLVNKGPMTPLNSIDSFGGIDADNDDLLYDCFEDHEAYQNLLARRHFLILGRKGSGKTAIFKKLQSESTPTFFSLGHTFTDYPWEYHAHQRRANVADSEVYTQAWTYLILLSLSKIILNQDNSLPIDASYYDEMAALERFVMDTYGTRDPDVSTIFRPSTQLKLKPHLDIDLKVFKAGLSAERLPITELPSVAHEVNQNILGHSLSLLNPEHEYHVAFDQLDLNFDPNSPDYNQRIIGLILAARNVNIAARNANKKALISLFLRSDIYDLLHFEDKNKITHSSVSVIAWDTQSSQHTLRELMERRFTKLFSDGEPVQWKDVFSNRDMAGRQKQYDHILARTYSRPRDIIQFLNETLRQHKKRDMYIRKSDKQEQDVDFDLNRFDNADIIAARELYSSGYLLKEIDDELHKQVPEYQKYLEIIKSIGTMQFSVGKFSDVYEERRKSLSLQAEPIAALRSLFDFSIIGYFKTGGRAGGSDYIFPYKQAVQSVPSFDDRGTLFRVHLGLLDALGLLKKTSVSAESELLDSDNSLDDESEFE